MLPQRHGEYVTIQIADRIYRLRTHQKYLVERNQQLVDEFKKGTGDAELIAKTMVCGTIIGGKNVRQVHERLNYCRVNKHCKACRAARFSDCARKIIDRLPGEKNACCIPCVIPFPQHHDYHETLDTARAALGLVKPIANMFCRWNQSAQHGRPDRILEYAIGLHLRFVESQQQLWPHVHVLLIAENGLQLESKNGRSLKESMDKCLRVATPEMAPIPFRFGEFDRFFVDSAGDVRSLQYGRRITRKDLERRMKYAMSMEEVGEETEGNCAGGYSIIADTMRHKMLADLGYPTTFTHSRTKKNDSAKVPSPTSQPCDFDPLPLKKDSVLQFDVLTHEFRPIKAEDYCQAKNQAIRSIRNDLLEIRQEYRDNRKGGV
ncbi:hypothetical protein RISK_005315 [Rhodopirellula islandica]|uniref:Replication protein n=1 Tax=Rhodopirellula islandica TaxID=595434 RepID=A0A0J1E9V3_RHOIS|nr:hypothetical protein RISK_005315 [Rhodopirellula islandica]